MNIEVIDFKSSKVINFAKAELTKYIKEIFATKDTNISYTFKKEKGFNFDGYSIEKNKSEVVFSASVERGILNGVYAFLRYLGCSFLFPGKDGEQIPKLNENDIEESFNLKEEPSIEYRGICLYNTTAKTINKTLNAIDWMGKNNFNFLLTSINRLDDTGCNMHAILWSEIGEIILPELQKRGIVIDMSEHSTDFYFPKYKMFEKHPEWFAEIDGERAPGQICYSNLEAVNAYGDAIADFVKDKDFFQFIGIWPLDGGGYCQCEKCKDDQTIFKANSIIAKKIEAVRPDLTVEHLAYTPQSFPLPKTPMPKNMCALVCHRRDDVAYDWAQASKNAKGAFYFEYMTGDHYRYRSNVILNPIRTRETVHTLISYGYRGAVSLYLPVNCTFQSSLNYYYMREFYFHPEKTVEEVSESLAIELFGKENKATGKKVLNGFINNLYNKILWNGFSFSNDWYKEHISNRNKKLDEIHANEFLKAFNDIKNNLNLIKQNSKGKALKNTETMLEFLELQYLYYFCVDSYNSETDTKEKAEPYFKKLKELEEKGDSPFITEEYARWRITGRDNIFKEEKNLFQVNE